MAKSGRLELGDNIYGQYRSIFNHWDVFGQQRNGNRRKTQNKGYYAVQGHPRSSKVIEIGTNWKPICDFLLVINSNWHPILYRFEDIAAYCSILDTLLFWATLCGLRDNIRCSSWAHWKAHSGLPISDNWTFSLGVMAEALQAKIDRKLAILRQCGHFDHAVTLTQISGRRGRSPPIFFAWIVRPMNALQLCRWQFSQE